MKHQLSPHEVFRYIPREGGVSRVEWLDEPPFIAKYRTAIKICTPFLLVGAAVVLLRISRMVTFLGENMGE